ncbi:uncharacterized protein LOC135982657 isoform X3 [Chrysemys picta bellii]|uniref:uncharacterized protein LOC135982657 isoform X3 n=1 Tax=Chrysemys picta bellii TaxID=8478 RepID=UPI0032B251BE
MRAFAALPLKGLRGPSPGYLRAQFSLDSDSFPHSSTPLGVCSFPAMRRPQSAPDTALFSAWDGQWSLTAGDPDVIPLYSPAGYAERARGCLPPLIHKRSATQSPAIH